MILIILALLWAASTITAHRVCPLGGDTCAVTVPFICPEDMFRPDNMRGPDLCRILIPRDLHRIPIPLDLHRTPIHRGRHRTPTPRGLRLDQSPKDLHRLLNSLRDLDQGPDSRDLHRDLKPTDLYQLLSSPRDLLRGPNRRDLHRDLTLGGLHRDLSPRHLPRDPALRDPIRRDRHPCPGPNDPYRLPPRQTSPAPTFSCIYDAYVIQDNNLYQMDLSSGRTMKLSDKIKGHIVGLVYNPLDRLLYGIDFDTVVRIYRNGTTEPVQQLPFVPTMGAIDREGRYWASIVGKDYATVDLHPSARPRGTILTRGKSTFPRTGVRMRFPTGWTISPMDPFHAYGIGFDYSVNRPALFRWKSLTATWEHVSTGTEMVNGDSFSAVVATNDGVIYGLEDETGDLVYYNTIEPYDMSVIRRVGPVSKRTPRGNTAARCPLLEDWRRREQRNRGIL
ncbi:hypothetical protein CP532_3061 [Ophiocordyceps camponoti-leonardi (nom. inval.)]|nr:hypothetical protein CP532_3061 [Ophiocordyceps camponoti-leonardi (nom. inval.)]